MQCDKSSSKLWASPGEASGYLQESFSYRDGGWGEGSSSQLINIPLCVMMLPLWEIRHEKFSRGAHIMRALHCSTVVFMCLMLYLLASSARVAACGGGIV